MKGLRRVSGTGRVCSVCRRRNYRANGVASRKGGKGWVVKAIISGASDPAASISLHLKSGVWIGTRLFGFGDTSRE